MRKWGGMILDKFDKRSKNVMKEVGCEVREETREGNVR